jgi:hypothetical protein
MTMSLDMLKRPRNTVRPLGRVRGTVPSQRESLWTRSTVSAVWLSGDDVQRLTLGAPNHELRGLAKRLLETTEAGPKDVHQKCIDTFCDWYLSWLREVVVDMQRTPAFIEEIEGRYRKIENVEKVRAEVSENDSRVHFSVLVNMPEYDDELMEKLVGIEIAAASIARKHGFRFTNEYIPVCSVST